MTTSETGRLAALERTLVGPRPQQAERRRGRARRAVILAAVAAPLILVAAGSVAATGVLGGIDPRLAACAQSASALAPGQSPSPRAGSSRDIASASRTPGGSFCFRFGRTHGRVSRNPALTPDAGRPATDNGPATFRVYGLAVDGVTAISVRARGVTRRAVMGRNAFYLEEDSLGGRGRSPVR